MLYVTPAWQRSSRHKIAVVSDLHFPRSDSHPKYLYEFLLNNPSDILVILGDFFEGYDKRLGEFGEWHKRCLDLMHMRKMEEDLKVIVIPGNHDQYLRDPRIIDHHLYGTLYRRNMLLDGHGGQKTYLTHGDDYDPKALRDSDCMLYQASDEIKFARVSLADIYNYYVGSSGSRLKPAFEKRTCADLAKKMRKGILASAQEHECNAVLTGHTHEPQPFKALKKHEWLQYGNSGAFSGPLATAMVLTHDDRWKMVNWREKREKEGFDRLPHREDENIAAAYRGLTEEEIHFQRTLHTVWVSRRVVEQAMQTVERIREIARKVEDLLCPQEEELDRMFQTIRPEPVQIEAGKVVGPVPVLAV